MPASAGVAPHRSKRRRQPCWPIRAGRPLRRGRARPARWRTPAQTAERLRTTLAAYFECHENKAAAATRLMIHEKTVAYRLRRAAKLIGSPVEQRRAELEAALMILHSSEERR